MGTAFLGWSPSEVWNAHLAEILIASRAKVRFESPAPRKKDSATEVIAKMDSVGKRLEQKYGNTGS